MTNGSQRADPAESRGALAVRQAVEAYKAGDYAGFLSRYADDAVYRVAGTANVIGGVYRGMAEIEAFFVRLGEVTGGTFDLDIVDVLGSYRRAVMIFHARASRDGRTLDDTGTMAFRLNDEGKFAESWLMYSDQAAYDEFFS